MSSATATAGALKTTDLDREEGRFNRGGFLLGIGFGGFVDGIVLHQLLQWHHMLTSTGDYPATTIAGLEKKRRPRARWPRCCSAAGAPAPRSRGRIRLCRH